MEQIRVKTSDQFNPDTMIFDDFYTRDSRKFVEVKNNEDSTIHFVIRGANIYCAVQNEMIPVILKNVEAGDYVETVIYSTPEDNDIIVSFINHSKNVEIINETSYDTYVAIKKREEELKRIKAETNKLEEEAERIEKIYQEYKKSKFERDSNIVYPFFESGDMIMTISKFVTDDKKELVELLALPYITPADYIMDVIKKNVPNHQNVHFKYRNVYDTMKTFKNPFKYTDKKYEIFISPVITSATYGHYSYKWKTCHPKIYHRYVWTRRENYDTACDNCFLTAMNLVIPPTFAKDFNPEEHIIPYEEIYDKYYRK